MRKGFSGKQKSHKSPVSLKSILFVSMEDFLCYFLLFSLRAISMGTSNWVHHHHRSDDAPDV